MLVPDTTGELDHLHPQNVTLKHQNRNGISRFIAIAVILTSLVVILAHNRSRSTVNENNDNKNDFTKSKTKKPNIVILFADNLAYNDISIFGAASAQTPNIDSIGYTGIKLQNWNSAAALCSASRAALLTGRYPVRSGIYPGVLKPDAEYGLMQNETTIAKVLKEHGGYNTAIIGKWHLGHRPQFLPAVHGFDSWLGIPYHMSGGSLEHHRCAYDVNHTYWLPLYQNETILQQPVDLRDLAQRYAIAAEEFIGKSVREEKPFFLYLPFSHVHQMCAPSYGSEQAACQWVGTQFSNTSPNGTFIDAVQEMDWIAGKILGALEAYDVADETLVLFTSDNGPWVAEEQCSGSKGPFEGRWLQENSSIECTACPHDYKSSPIPDRPRRCVNPTNGLEVEGVHCGADTGLGGVWEANIRMPALAKWPGRIPPQSSTMATLSTLDIFPTLLKLADIDFHNLYPGTELDGMDIREILYQKENHSTKKESLRTMPEIQKFDERILYLWRDGFSSGPLPAPFGRFDVAAVKYQHLKFWFWTKSAHYNPDVEVFHDPPLIFDIIQDPAEAFPLDPTLFLDEIEYVKEQVAKHKFALEPYGQPLTLSRDLKYVPCANAENECRTS